MMNQETGDRPLLTATTVPMRPRITKAAGAITSTTLNQARGSRPAGRLPPLPRNLGAGWQRAGWGKSELAAGQLEVSGRHHGGRLAVDCLPRPVVGQHLPCAVVVDVQDHGLAGEGGGHRRAVRPDRGAGVASPGGTGEHEPRACRVDTSADATVPQRTASTKAPRTSGSSHLPGSGTSGRAPEGITARPGSTSQMTESSSPMSSSDTDVSVTSVRPGGTVTASSREANASSVPLSLGGRIVTGPVVVLIVVPCMSPGSAPSSGIQAGSTGVHGRSGRRRFSPTGFSGWCWGDDDHWDGRTPKARTMRSGRRWSCGAERGGGQGFGFPARGEVVDGLALP